MEIAKHNKEVWKKYFRDAVPELYKDEFIQRQIKFAHILGTSALEENKLAQVSRNFKVISTALSWIKHMFNVITRNVKYVIENIRLYKFFLLTIVR